MKTYIDLFSIEGIHFRIYGLMFVISYFLIYFWLKRRESWISEHAERWIDAMDVMLYAAVGMIIGARLMHVMASGIESGFGPYLSQPLEIIAVWHGGLSYHGGLLGGLLGLYIYAKKVGLNVLLLTDRIVVILPLGSILVKFSNFLAGDLLGRPHGGFLSIKYNFDNISRYPAQLFEAFGNLLVFGLLFWLTKRKYKKGRLTLIYVVLALLVRFIVDFYREPTRLYSGLTLAQWLSLVVCAFVVLNLLCNNHHRRAN